MACELSLVQVLEATGGQMASTLEKRFIGVGTDTRANLDKQIFVALKGDKFDAHNFLSKAVVAGAKCLIVHDETVLNEPLKKTVTIVVVKDTLKALQDLAIYWRKHVTAKVFGITGSNGKTTTKEFAAAILSAQFKVHYSKGSYNNHWGVPLTILGISRFHEVALVEMGMNHPEELTALSKIAQPDVVLCTTVGRAHIGNFEGSQQAIADAKEEIYLANPNAIKIFNYDNEFTLKMCERVSKLLGKDKVLSFSSFVTSADVSLRATNMDLNGIRVVGHIAGVKGEANVNIFGRQNVVNLMGAACIALEMKMQPEFIWASLSRCKSEWGRNQLVPLDNGIKILFDAYNANPDSMTALIKSVFEIPVGEGGHKIAVLGEMLELGDSAEKYHQELGELVGQTDLNMVWFYGPHYKAFLRGVENTGTQKDIIVTEDFDLKVANKLLSIISPRDIVVLKGSRGMKLERVVQAWAPQFTSYV